MKGTREHWKGQHVSSSMALKALDRSESDCAAGANPPSDSTLLSIRHKAMVIAVNDGG